MKRTLDVGRSVAAASKLPGGDENDWMWEEAAGQAMQLYGSVVEADRVEYDRAGSHVAREVRRFQKEEDLRR